jgi:tetratricopeptide (TPR) repeat protein
MPTLPPPAPENLAELTRLYGEGRYLDAFHYAEEFAPPEAWPSPEGLILAGRLMYSWGDWLRSNRMHAAAWRQAPMDPTTVYYQALSVEHRHGAFEALRFLREQRAVVDAPEPAAPHAWLWLHQARLLSTFRDFEEADALVRRARPLGETDPWWWVERSRILEQQDKYTEALESAQQGLRLRPRYRPALEAQAHLLTILNRDEEALGLFQDAMANLQVGSLGQSFAILLSELEQHVEVLPVLDRVSELMPCANRFQRQWIASRRADALRHLGRDQEAAVAARAAKSPFQDHIAEHLEKTPAPRQKPIQLRVGFVRQHHMTCAPATLTALSHFWQRPVDHLELARIICYDGTPDHEERHWAETHGWLVREFRVTWESATALLDRGCPFTLTTVAPRSAHLQAVVGYDASLGLLFIRDPYQRTHGECIAKNFLAACASHGPRGMVLVPADRPELLAGVEFADAALYDAWYTLRRALLRNERGAAQLAADGLVALDPQHSLTLLAQRELALYDGNMLRQFEATRALLARFPDDPNFRLDEVQYLRALGRNAEMRERIAALARRDADALALRERAELLATDARTHPRAHRLFRRVLRRRGVDAANLRAFANLLWSQREFAAATDVYRLAACVGEKIEHHWDSYFAACRHVRTAEACLALLRQREARLGPQSAQPTRTLFRACEALDRTLEGFIALDAALARRPDDGELLLFAAECRGRFGQPEESARLLAAAKDRSLPLPWRRVAARLAEIRPDHAAALAHYREVLVLNPVDVDAHASIARLSATLEGRPAALSFLRGAAAQHPTLIPLHTLILEWLRHEPPEEALLAIDHFLSLEPDNAWALREKALILRRQHRPDDALPLAQTACRIEPQSHLSPGILGLVLVSLNRTAEARAAFEDSLRLSLDAGYMHELFDCTADFGTRREAVAFIQAELVRQALLEDMAVLRFRELARTVLSPEETQAALEKVLAAHPGHWAAWSVLGAHLVDQGKAEEALQHMRSATERFPLSPRIWVDYAAAQALKRQPAAEIESLSRALELSPAWGRAARALSEAQERALDLDAAEHVLRRAVSSDPVDAGNHAYLADLLWRRGQKPEALILVKRAVTLDPSFDWAWQHLDQWAAAKGEPKLAIELAETMTGTRPGDVHAWIRLARLQSDEPDIALVTLDRALALNPRDVEIHELRAFLLSAAGRHEAALAACRPEVFGDRPPHLLRGRAAWIEHRRGNQATALVQIRQVVQDHPDYTWGWSCLTEWSWERNEAQPTLEAATKWSWLASGRAVPLGYVAVAQQRLGQRREAKQALWRALDREPTYSYGAQTLLQWLAEDRDLDEAARLLRHIETHLSAAEAKRSAVLFHVMRKDKSAAATALAELARLSGDQPALLTESAKAMTEAGWRKLVEISLAPLLTEPGLPPGVARRWVQAWAPDQRWKEISRLAKRNPSEPVLRTAWAVTLEQMGAKKCEWRLRWIRRTRGRWLQAEAETWGAMGYALVTAGMPAAALDWLKDWRERQGIQPWMLYNLTLACYYRGDSELAQRVISHALSLPADATRHDFIAWLGLERALRNDWNGATDSLSQTKDIQLDFEPNLVRVFTQLLVDFNAQLASSPKPALREAKRRLASLFADSPQAGSNDMLLHFRRRALQHLALRSGSGWTRVQSIFLPSRPRAFESKSKGEFPYLWIIWMAFIALSTLGRGCSH